MQAIRECWAARAECSISRCTTLVLCFFSMVYCFGLSMAVISADTGPGVAFLVIFVGWNVVLLKSTWRNADFNPLVNCLSSCLSVVLLLTSSFTIISRYHYYGRWPKYPDVRVGTSYLLYHKMGLIIIVSGIPLMYKWNCDNLADDKETIYTILADFIDIYDMAGVLALGSPTCKPVDSNYGIYNRRLHCTESTYYSLKEGGSIETAVQGFCSFSFFIFVMIYVEALGSEYIGSMKKYIRLIILLQDIPFFIIRTVVWFNYGFQTDQFLFLVKNIVAASLTVIDFFSPIYQLDQESTQSADEGQQENAEQQTSQTNSGVEGHP